jgi:hypothetical protein
MPRTPERAPKRSPRRLRPHADLPGAYSPHESWLISLYGGPPPPNVTGVDRELLFLVSALYDAADSAGSLALVGLRSPFDERQLWLPGVSNESLTALPPDLAERKAKEAERIRRTLLAWHGLEPDDGAPYKFARLWFTQWILTHADSIRQHLAGDGVSPRERAETSRLSSMCMMLARHVADMVAAGYPALAGRVHNPERLARIERAIRGAVESEKRIPWTAIVEAWGSVERLDDNGPALDAETWRHAWEDHCLDRDRRKPSGSPSP